MPVSNPQRNSSAPEAQGLQIYGLVNDSIVDGPGLRYVVFVQGCTHKCPGCHNPESQPAGGGEWKTLDEIYNDIKANKLVDAVTFSGGEPFEQPAGCAELAARLKSDGYDIWSYSGYLFEDLLAKSRDAANPDAAHIKRLLESIDVLVDGPYLEAKHSYSLEWRGSSNQRLIDVPSSLAAGKVVLWSAQSYEWEQPPSW